MFSQSQGALGSEYQQQQGGSTTHTMSTPEAAMPITMPHIQNIKTAMKMSTL
ncbi:hypothetical protein HO173_003903 [Letharia columbiana]|uniref:Uncharacterized protein n=1 Tax=Letharia columbiana TaxID=112416 RepID=A0A8H6FZP2_9LECA|nr:uncharacterized protein HO173_003903 [Letharia columbiana]KAF6237702.1 hypothetical protein HO173_003903 [Letharia columbiana]